MYSANHWHIHRDKGPLRSFSLSTYTKFNFSHCLFMVLTVLHYHSIEARCLRNKTLPFNNKDSWYIAYHHKWREQIISYFLVVPTAQKLLLLYRNFSMVSYLHKLITYEIQTQAKHVQQYNTNSPINGKSNKSQRLVFWTNFS